MKSTPLGAATGSAFAGESYVLVDVSSYQEESLPPDNLASLVVATERMRGLEQAGAMLEMALRQLSAPGLEAVRDTYLEWFRLLVRGFGIEVEFLEGRVMMEQMEQSGALRTTLEERVRAQFDSVRAEGLNEGIEHERKLLTRLAERKLGASVAERVGELLSGIDDPRHLRKVGDWIIDCDEGRDLIALLEAA